MASNLKVIIDNPQTTIKIPSGTRMLVRRSCHAVLEYEKYDKHAEINVVFSDNDMLRANEDKRVSNFEAPEVIALPSDSEENLGTLIISVERITELTKVYNESFEMGVVYATIHGVLNLLGQYYTDARAKEDLMVKEALLLTQLGFSPLAGFTGVIL